MMNKELLKEQCEKINDIFAQLSAKQITVTDGVIDIDRYFDAKPRILWILKEANSEESWSYLDAFRDAAWLNKCNGLSSIRRVIYTSYGILNGINKTWSEFPWSNESQSQDALLGIAYINIKKSPGESTSNPQELTDAYQTYRELLKLQIDTYDADVIIFGNTMNYVNIADFKDLLNAKRQVSKYNNHFYYAGDKLYIHAYHPSYLKGFTDEIYAMDIVKIVKDWQNKK